MRLNLRHFQVPLLSLLLAALFAGALGGCGKTEQSPASESLTLGDGTVIEHPWDAAGPLPAANDWLKVEVAGYQLSENKDGPGFSWTWTFTLGFVHTSIDLVAVTDVSDATPMRLVDPGEGVFTGERWLAQSTPTPVSAFHQPWLFRDGDSVRVLRFSIADTNGETRILYQPVLFSHDAKQRLTSIARDALLET